MHDLHVGHILFYLVAFEIAAFVLTSVILLIKWTRAGHPFSSAWGIVFGSEVRFFEFLPLFVTINGISFVIWILWLVASHFGITLSW